MKAALALAAAASALATGAVASPSYTPPPGSTERAAIADAIRAGTHSTTIMVFDHLRVARLGRYRTAYIEVHPFRADAARPFSGWAILSNSPSGWHVLWAVRDSGATACSIMSHAYKSALHLGRVAGADGSFFSARFYAEATDSEAVASDDVACIGDLIIDGQ